MAAAIFILMGEVILNFMMQHQDFHFSVSEKDRCFSSITSLIARPFFAQSLKKRLDMPLVHGYRVQIAACDSE